jgi:predicted kinase
LAAAAIDLDLVYEMLEPDYVPKEDVAKWRRARRAAAALTDALLGDGVHVVLVEGDFLNPEQRAEFVAALRSSSAPVFVTLHVPIDLALERVQKDPTRGVSRDPHFLRSHYEQLAGVIRNRPATDLVLDTATVGVDAAARAIVEWESGAAGEP